MKKLSKISTPKKVLVIGLGILALGVVVLGLSLSQSLTFQWERSIKLPHPETA